MPINVTRFRFAEPTSFEPNQWDKYEYTSMLDASARLARLANRQIERYGRSLVADAFYTLSGLTPNQPDQIGNAWKVIARADGFQRLSWKANMQDMVIQTEKLATKVEELLFHSRMEEADWLKSEEELFEGQDPPLDLTDLPFVEADDALAQAEDSDPTDVTSEDGEDGVASALISVEQAEEIVGEAQDATVVIRCLQGGLDGTDPIKTLDEAIALSKMYDISEFAQILGWAERFSMGAARENRYGREELTGYTADAWSDDVTPDEMIAVAQGDPAALIRFAESALATSDYHSIEPMGRGPVVIMRDESTSMAFNATTRKERHERAQMMELALADVFNRQKRDLVSIAWSDKVARFDRERKTGKVPSVRTHTYGEPGMREHLTTMQMGGTELEPVLEQAALVAFEWAEPADILILSDMGFNNQDAANLNVVCNDILADFREDGGRVWAIIFGDADPAIDVLLKGWVDGYVAQDKLQANQETGAIVAAMTRNDRAEGHSKRMV